MFQQEFSRNYFQGKIEFRNVNFFYEGEDVIKDLSSWLNQENTALVAQLAQVRQL